MAIFNLQRRITRLKRRYKWAVQNLRGAARFRQEVLGSNAPLDDLTRYEQRVYSQNGEDGILDAIFARVARPTASSSNSALAAAANVTREN